MRVFGVSVWAILLAAAMGFVLAMIWFGGGAFGSGWMAAVRQDLAWASGQFRGISVIVGFASQLVTCIGLAWLLNRLGRRGFVSGLVVGALAAVGFVASAFAANFAWLHAGQSLPWLESAYALIYMALAGGVLGASRRG
jgi:hypothetical protein